MSKRSDKLVLQKIVAEACPILPGRKRYFAAFSDADGTERSITFESTDILSNN